MRLNASACWTDFTSQSEFPTHQGRRRKRMMPRMFCRVGMKTPFMVPSFEPSPSLKENAFSRESNLLSNSVGNIGFTWSRLKNKFQSTMCSSNSKNEKLNFQPIIQWIKFTSFSFTATTFSSPWRVHLILHFDIGHLRLCWECDAKVPTLEQNTAFGFSRSQNDWFLKIRIRIDQSTQRARKKAIRGPHDD